MQKAKIEQRIQKLNRLKDVVEIAKFDTLSKLNELEKVTSQHKELARETMNILAFSKQKLAIFTPHEKVPKKILYVYFSFESKLIKVSHQQQEEMLMKYYNRDTDGLITVGEVAKTFAHKNNLNVITSYQEGEESARDISYIAENLLENGQYDGIKVIGKMNSADKEPITVYPIGNIDEETYKMYDKKTFYFSLPYVVENLSSIYMFNRLSGLKGEARYKFYQEKLVMHENSINNIDEKIDSLKYSILKLERKNETEEMITLSQNIRRSEDE